MYEVLLKDDNRDNTDESASAASATEQTNTGTQTTAEQQPATAPQRAEKFDELLDTDKGKTEKTDDAQDNTATDVYSRYRDKVAARGSARMALAEMMRPEDQSRRERNLRRVALGQALGEIIGGLFGFGIAQKNGSSVVVPESQATKTQQRLLKLQEQGLADREQYRTMLAKLRMDNLDKELAEERYLTGLEATRAERDAARAHQAEMLDKKLEAEKTRRQQKNKQWQTRHDETVRHNKAMEANRGKSSSRGSGSAGKRGSWASGFSDLDYRLITITTPEKRTESSVKYRRGREDSKITHEEDFVIKNEAEARQILIAAKRRLEELGLPYDEDGVETLEYIKKTRVDVPSQGEMTIEQFIDTNPDIKSMLADGRIGIDELETLLNNGLTVDDIKEFANNAEQ